VRFLIAIALLFSITPGMSEVAEAAVHLITHADLPHHETDADHGKACGEHSCTPLAHHCGCHATMSARLESRTVSTTTFCNSSRLDPNAIIAMFDRSSEPPPLRPPIV